MRKTFFVSISLLCLGLLLPLAKVQAQQTGAVDAMRFIKQNAKAIGLTDFDLDNLVIADQYVTSHNGVNHVIIQQMYEDIPVFGGQINLSIDGDGNILHAARRFVPDLENVIHSTAQALGAQEAVYAAADNLGLEITGSLGVEPMPPNMQAQAAKSPYDVLLSDGGISLEPIPANLVFLPTPEGDIRLVWNVGIYTLDGGHYWSAFVDASNGVVVQSLDLVVHEKNGVLENKATSFAAQVREAGAMAPLFPYATAVASAPAQGSAMGGTYNVYPAPIESPSHAGDPLVDLRQLVSNPSNAIASPLGWHNDGASTYTVTRGNNVHAYTDVDANGVPDPGSDPDGGSGLVFDFPLDLTQHPSTYRDAAVTNLFYWNNLIHDIAYMYGFDEAAGNFQVKNIGNAGLGGDYVRAEAQDGSGTNNANFFTPSDGNRPRMQMFIWTASALLTVNSPASIAGDYPAGSAGFGTPLDPTGVTGDIELVDDGTALGSQGCNALVGFTPGKVALIDRGSCEFGLKVLNAENAGAIAAIVVNNQGDGVINMGGGTFGSQVTISSVFIGQSNGGLIKAELPGVNATMKKDGIDRDSDLDNGIIVHEYAHGISNRLTGGPSQTSCLANFIVNGQVDGEQMGEGWSDYFALMLTDTNTDNRGIGTYAIFEPTTGGGIRPFPYSTSMAINPTTYASINNPTFSVPHGVGSVWATMLWDMTRDLVAKHGFDPDIYKGKGGNNIALQLVTDGMKLQPCRPGFVDGRDAILAADQALTRGENSCTIWNAFARRGLGYSADQGAFFTRFDGTEAFDLPPLCDLTAEVDALYDNGVLDQSQYNSLTQKLQQVQEKISAGQTKVAINVLNAFIAEVNDLIADGVLTPEQGQVLIDKAAAIITGLGGTVAASKPAVAPRGAMDALSAELPTEFSIDQNYPNPFNPTTQIRFALPEASQVRLSVYDVMGREVERLVDGEMRAGYHEVSFDGEGLTSGMYFYRIEAGDFINVKRMVLVK